MKTFLSGISGRLGREVENVLANRGDEFVQASEDLNYMIFAHRYRGADDFREEMRVNVEEVVLKIEAAKWAEGDKAIVLVSSISAVTPAENQTLAYNLSKAALNQLARCYAKKHRINTVSPNTFTGESPIISRRQVADVIAFLCSEQGSGINGQDVRVG